MAKAKAKSVATTIQHRSLKQMSDFLQLYDLVYNDIAARMVHGVVLQSGHTCAFHSIPCKTIVYLLSSTTDHSWTNTEWCREKIEQNGYRKDIDENSKKDIISYKPYTDRIAGEPLYTHLYVLQAGSQRWHIKLASDWPSVSRLYNPEAIYEIVEFPEALPLHQAVVHMNAKVFELGYENCQKEMP